MEPCVTMDIEEATEAAGFTEKEAEAWELVTQAAAACLNLSDREGSHPMMREEFCHEFHHIQMRLASLPALRAMGLGPQSD